MRVSHHLATLSFRYQLYLNFHQLDHQKILLANHKLIIYMLNKRSRDMHVVPGSRKQNEKKQQVTEKFLERM